MSKGYIHIPGGYIELTSENQDKEFLNFFERGCISCGEKEKTRCQAKQVRSKEDNTKFVIINELFCWPCTEQLPEFYELPDEGEFEWDGELITKEEFKKRRL